MSVDQQVKDISIAREAAHLTQAEINRREVKRGKPLVDRDRIAGQLGDTHVEAAQKIVEAEEKAGLDQLTGLLNRKGLQDRLIEMKRSPEEYLDHQGDQLVGQSVLVLMMDLDYFRRFNEQYGHGLGDDVLQTFAEVLKKSIRRTDAILRYGGEEFVIFLFGSVMVGKDVYEKISNRLKDLLISTGENGETMRINFSAGLAKVEWREVEKIVEAQDRRELNKAVGEVCKKADEALNEAKKTRGCLVIASE